MKQKIYTMLLVIAVIATTQLSHAQSPYTLNQVIVLNQGPYGATPGPTIGSYNPATKTYQNFDTISSAAFASYVIIDSGYIYAAVDSFLIKYNLDTKEKIATQIVPGIREIAVWGNELLVTRGDVNALNSYFQVYSKDLQLIYQLTSVSAATEGIKVLNDTAYVAVNGFGTVGSLAVIDLNKEIENREIDLGTTGFDPYDVEVEKTTNTVYTVNTPSNSISITEYYPTSGTFNTTLVNTTTPYGCNGSAYYLDNIYFQAFNDNNVQIFRTSQLDVWDSLKINKSIAGIAPDSVHGYMYIGNTDYATYGKVYIYDLFSDLIDTFNANVDPSNFAFDIRSTTGINQVSSFAANLVMYPNPVTDQLHVALIDSKDAQANLTLIDILGRQVYQQQVPTNASVIVPMNSLSPGIYFLKAETNSGELTQKIVKE